MALWLGLESDLNKGLGEGPARVKKSVGMLGLELGDGKFIMSMFPHKGRSTRVCMCVVEPCGLLSSSLPQLDSDG